MIRCDIFVNCNWVVTRWQYYSTHLHTDKNNTNNNRTTQITTNLGECWPCPVFANFTLAFALQLRKKHGKTSCPTLRKLEFSRQFSEIKTQKSKFHENPSSRKKSSYRRTDKTKLRVAFRNFADVPKYDSFVLKIK